MTSTELEQLRAAILTVLDDGYTDLGVKGPWHFYENGRVDEAEANEDRLRFCDAVQSHLIKSIQRAEDENALICPECGLKNDHSNFCPRIDFEEALKEM